MKELVREIIRNNFGLEVRRHQKRGGHIEKPLDTIGVDILLDSQFQSSVKQARQYTLLDTERLANLWQLARMTNPKGAIVEVGSFQGGSALHLSNACPDRKVFVCDTFESFGALNLDSHLDSNFEKDQFVNTSYDKVLQLFADRRDRVKVLQGYFPESDRNREISQISFVHLDVDIYESTINTLEYLKDHFIEKSIIVLDDYLRSALGIERAVQTFTEKNRDWVTFPIFPGQGLMIHRSWFS